MSADRVAGGALVLVGLYTLWESRVLPLGTLRSPGPAYMPVLLALLLVLLGALIVLAGAAGAPIRTLGWAEAPRAVTIVVACAAAVFVHDRLGYRVTMTLLLLFLIGVVERRHPVFAVLFAVGLAVVTFLVFDTWLRVPLPRGPWGL